MTRTRVGAGRGEQVPVEVAAGRELAAADEREGAAHGAPSLGGLMGWATAVRQ